jgi:hypothetical protein
MNNELERMWKEVLSGRPLGGTEETHENLSQDIRYMGQGLKPEPPEYEGGLIHTPA